MTTYRPSGIIKANTPALLQQPGAWQKPTAEVPAWTIYHSPNAARNAALGNPQQNSTKTNPVKTACAASASRAIPRGSLSGSATTEIKLRPSVADISSATASGSTNERPTISGATLIKSGSGGATDGNATVSGATWHGVSARPTGSQCQSQRRATVPICVIKRGYANALGSTTNPTRIRPEKRSSGGEAERLMLLAMQAQSKYGRALNTMALVAGYAARNMRR